MHNCVGEWAMSVRSRAAFVCPTVRDRTQLFFFFFFCREAPSARVACDDGVGLYNTEPNRSSGENPLEKFPGSKGLLFAHVVPPHWGPL